MITASGDTLMRQAPATIEVYMIDAVDMIDKKFGTGYSQKHPELVAAFIQASSVDLASAIITKGLQEIGNSIIELSEAIKEHE